MSAKKATLVEVGLRDGLQNEKSLIDVETKVELARRLANAGLRRLEVGAFVHPKWVPQMAGSMEVTKAVLALKGAGLVPFKAEWSALVPNERGMTEALASGVGEVAVFAACSESFSKKNINCSIDESFERFIPVFRLARKNRLKVRGYLSTCFGCPFEGDVDPKLVIRLAKRLVKLGAYEISIGDTIGVATPTAVETMFRSLKRSIPVRRLAGHFHDTRGQALANVLSAWKQGVTVFDTSVGGLGGCPYAPGATGNVATEDVAYMFEGMGIKTGVDLDALINMQGWISEKVGHALPSRVGKAGRLQPLGSVV